jgi:F420H(2)-dependent quinone reductase
MNADKGLTGEQRQLIASALARDKLVDIVTTGRKSGKPRRLEIWFHALDGRIIITGTPGRRGWLANLRSNPEMRFCLKESIKIELPARACEITAVEERQDLLTRPETAWYREQGFSLQALVNCAPMIEVCLKSCDS